jgi:predicted transcriptional regulator
VCAAHVPRRVPCLKDCSLSISDDLSRAIEAAAREADTTKSEVLRKALQLFIAIQKGKREGKTAGLVDAQTRKLEVEFIGL